MSRLPLTALAAFEAAARHGGMTRAAEEVGLTHGAISRQVGDLEKRLGVRLFDRTPRGLVLTDAGRELARACTSGLGRMTEAFDRVASGGPLRLRVAAPRAWAALWLVPRLPRFLADWPGLRVDLDGSNHDRPAEMESGWVVIRYVRGGDPIPEGDVLSEEALIPVCAPSVAQGLSGPSDLLTGDVALLHVHEWADWRVWKAAAGIEALDSSGGLSFSDSVMVMRAAESGLGVALARPVLALNALNDGRLVCPFGPAAACGDRYVLAAPAGGRVRRLPLAFRAWLMAEVERDRDRLRSVLPV